MIWWQLTLLIFGALSLLLLSGIPVAFAFITINIAGGLVYLGGMDGLPQLARSGMSAITNFSLTPIPFFLLMGELLLHTGVAMKAIDAFDGLISRVPGRLAVIAVVAGTVFSAISGSTVATTALLGSVLLPQMLARGYHPHMGVGPIMAIGGVDALIPPSAITVLFGSLASISVSGLLMGGVVPGIMLSVLFVGYIIFKAWRHPEMAPSFETQRLRGWQRWRPVVVYVSPLVGIFLVVIVAMTRGWATPTESAAIGALATVAVCALYRSLTLKNLAQALLGTAAVSGMILFIIFGATTFSQILVFTGATNGMVNLIQGQGFSAGTVIVVMMLILLVLGCFLDQVAIMLITLPFFMPIVQQYGIDPVWFGILFMICMQLGLLTPPFGTLLFTMRSVAPASVTTLDIYRAVLPYVGFGLLVLVLVFYFPALATWLPAAMSR
ncbi:TRAP transporter large permease [Hydrogenophaga atypica]|uniref:TRAP transporter large permease protein n=1 Tax=Hydrogenophaga atypica TaxID=249409 RepID=A0ABW2QJ12_9BURK